jgi:hypothetical protein
MSIWIDIEKINLIKATSIDPVEDRYAKNRRI